MRAIVLIPVIISVFAGCKASQKTAVKTVSESAFDQNDDEAIDVPKELEEKVALTQNPSLSSRGRLTRENVSKDLAPGAKLSIKVKGSQALQIDLYAKAFAAGTSLAIEGSSMKKFDLKNAMSSFEVPVRSSGEETVIVSIPDGKDLGLQVTQIVPKEGEIISWKILER